MPIGWGTPAGKRAVLDTINAKIQTRKDQQEALITKAGRIALLGREPRSTPLDDIKVQYDKLSAEIRLLNELHREVGDLSSTDLSW